MTIKISWPNKPLKQLKKLPNAEDQKKVFNEISKLEAEPWVDLNVEKVKNGKADYRLKIGSYRVLFDLDKKTDPKELVIKEILARTGNTYNKK